MREKKGRPSFENSMNGHFSARGIVPQFSGLLRVQFNKKFKGLLSHSRWTHQTHVHNRELINYILFTSVMYYDHISTSAMIEVNRGGAPQSPQC